MQQPIFRTCSGSVALTDLPHSAMVQAVLCVSFLSFDDSDSFAVQEAQGNWVIDCIKFMKERNLSRIEPTVSSEQEWCKLVDEITAGTLLSKQASSRTWYLGANIPGKPIQSLNFLGGLRRYIEKGKECAENEYAGFHFEPRHRL
jgi:hypothetical protein